MRSNKKAETAASIGASIGASLGGKAGPVGAGIGGGFGGATGYIAGALLPDCGCCGGKKKLLPDGGQSAGDRAATDRVDNAGDDGVFIPVTEE
ncbi:hypothetical protein EGH24_01370 [Halonotius terrestris]|uniref:Uncharacterized protein n=1 Tax=Halonotius terrestris TaxID=2487750 RepID=A0A8J8TDN3_9EURY|nr:hypothetical protein [Halonotius terrestris]TQQ83472.1 hypothetical protein EGH24_01370 [Halonotius terrestris]